MLRNIIIYIRKNFIQFSVIIICIYALYIRIMVLKQHILWSDELWLIDEMKVNFFEFLKELPNYEYCSFLSGDLILVYPFFKIFSYNKWGLAIPHIIATILGFYLLYLICKKYFKSGFAYFVTFSIVCFNATLIHHATEIRPYAVLPTLALGTLYLCQLLFDLKFELSSLKRTGAILLSILIIWFHVYGIVMFSSFFLFFFLTKCRDNDFKTYFKKSTTFFIIVLCFSMPFWLYSVFGPHVQYSTGGLGFDPFQYIANPLSNTVQFVKDIFCNLIGFKILYFLVLGIMVPFIFVYKDRQKQLLFLFICILIPIAFILIFDIAGKYWFLQRQFIWTMPLFAFFLGWTWDSLFLLLRRKNFKDKND